MGDKRRLALTTRAAVCRAIDGYSGPASCPCKNIRPIVYLMQIYPVQPDWHARATVASCATTASSTSARRTCARSPISLSVIVTSGPMIAPDPIVVAPSTWVPGRITVSAPMLTSTSIHVLAGSTIVTPAPAADATVAASEDIDPEPMTTTRRPASASPHGRSSGE